MRYLGRDRQSAIPIGVGRVRVPQGAQAGKAKQGQTCTRNPSGVLATEVKRAARVGASAPRCVVQQRASAPRLLCRATSSKPAVGAAVRDV